MHIYTEGRLRNFLRKYLRKHRILCPERLGKNLKSLRHFEIKSGIVMHIYTEGRLRNFLRKYLRKHLRKYALEIRILFPERHGK